LNVLKSVVFEKNEERKKNFLFLAKQGKKKNTVVDTLNGDAAVWSYPESGL
jgi:hypothetical protein